MKRRLLLVISSFIFCVGLSIGIDRAFGWWRPTLPQTGFVFPPKTSRYFSTPEFSYTATTNSLGFRDREFAVPRTPKTRIVAIGDSFTYGWGVDIDQSWPKVLERLLQPSDVEVANLGKPGGTPRTYADLAEKVIPVLKPDLVIVAVLQGDDLAQMDLPGTVNVVSGQEAGQQPRLRSLARRLYPNFVRLMDQRSNSAPALSEQWKQEAQALLGIFTPPERARLEGIDSRVRQSFLNGELNPGLIYLSIHDPEYFSQTLDQNSPRVKAWVAKMAEQFRRIKNVADHNDADVLIVSMPYGIYVSSSSLLSRAGLGFKTVPEMLTTTAEDEEIRDASQLAGIRFVEFTREFRQLSLRQNFFFEFDGHLNAAGHDFFAHAVMPDVQTELLKRKSN